jgi:hypothetical protein
VLLLLVLLLVLLVPLVLLSLPLLLPVLLVLPPAPAFPLLLLLPLLMLLPMLLLLLLSARPWAHPPPPPRVRARQPWPHLRPGGAHPGAHRRLLGLHRPSLGSVGWDGRWDRRQLA